MKQNSSLRETLQQFKRQALHAKTLGFIHPIKKEPVQWHAKIPEDMSELYKKLNAELT